MLTIKSRYDGIESNQTIKSSYTIGLLSRKNFKEFLDKNLNIVQYRETKGIIDSNFFVIGPVWIHKYIEKAIAQINSEDRIIKTNSKNINTVKTIVEHYALNITINQKQQLVVEFPNEEYIEKFRTEMKQRKIKIAIKNL